MPTSYLKVDNDLRKTKVLIHVLWRQPPGHVWLVNMTYFYRICGQRNCQRRYERLDWRM